METLWTIISWAVFGLIVGGIARLLVPGEQAIGCLATIILGIVGSFVGGGLYALFTGSFDYRDPAGWILSLVGAVIALLIWIKLAPRKTV